MYKTIIKRLVDILLSFSAIVVLSPLFIIISSWLFFANKGTGVFFSQVRPGMNEVKFKLIKFKSMNDKKDENGNLLPDAQRVTNIGRFIRKTSLDELPQLFNILIGKMSFVGPRPLLIRYLPYYTKNESKRHSVRPGLTGLAQISGRNKIDWDSKLKLDLQYVESISFTNDLKIVLITVKKVLKREGVVEDKVENFLDVERKKNRKI